MEERCHTNDPSTSMPISQFLLEKGKHITDGLSVRFIDFCQPIPQTFPLPQHVRTKHAVEKGNQLSAVTPRCRLIYRAEWLGSPRLFLSAKSMTVRLGPPNIYTGRICIYKGHTNNVDRLHRDDCFFCFVRRKYSCERSHPCAGRSVCNELGCVMCVVVQPLWAIAAGLSPEHFSPSMISVVGVGADAQQCRESTKARLSPLNMW